MSRSFRVYEKKRGNRRTGSGALGTAGETAFFGLLFLAGCGGIVAIILTLVIPEWRANNEFVETTCVVRGKAIGRSGGDETLYRPEIQIEYEIHGKTYVTKTYDIRGKYSGDREKKQAILDRFEIGKRYPCWYDPLDHNVVVIERGYSWWVWLTFIIPASFVLIGGGGFLYRALHWGKSAEHRAAGRRGGAGRQFDRLGTPEHELPNVPPGADMTNSPGTTLAFRLPISTSPTWALIGLLFICLFWNGIVSVFVVGAVGGHLAGKPDWVLTIFMVPFVLVGVGLIFWFFRQLLVTTGVGPTLLEISDHPLRPDREYRLFLSQSGRLRINSLAVFLVCEEEVRYRQGTDTRTESRVVYEQQVYLREGFEIQRGAPLEVQCEPRVPLGAMHSFKSDNNEVNWKFVVRGDVAGWPDFSRAFPVIVHPADDSPDDRRTRG